MPSLNGQRVVVIGGSAGIGLAVAKAALAEGAQVVIGSSQAANVEAAVAQLGAGARGAVADVTDAASLAAFFETAGAFDHLVFTAGDWGPHLFAGPIATADIALAKAGLEVRFWGAIAAIQAGLKSISPNGSITLTDGVLVHRPQRGAPLTAAFGGALEHLARGLAVDLAPIRVNSVCPGLTLTERWANPPPEMLSQIEARQPIPRAAQPAEVAEAYLYLMRGTYTTGQVMIVDGGGLLT